MQRVVFEVNFLQCFRLAQIFTATFWFNELLYVSDTLTSQESIQDKISGLTFQRLTMRKFVRSRS